MVMLILALIFDIDIDIDLKGRLQAALRCLFQDCPFNTVFQYCLFDTVFSILSSQYCLLTHCHSSPHTPVAGAGAAQAPSAPLVLGRGPHRSAAPLAAAGLLLGCCWLLLAAAVLCCAVLPAGVPR